MHTHAQVKQYLSAEEEASQALQTQVDEETVRRSKLTALIEQYNATTTTTAPPTDTTTYNSNSTVDIEEGKSSSTRGSRLNKTATMSKNTVSGSAADKKWNQTTR